MSLAKSVSEPSRTESSVEVASTASGGADVANAIYRSGATVGYRSAEKRPPEEVPVGFVDWPFDCERTNH
jgi:hypothetical protein